eukprot:4098096-Amphidinium_carterae.1
MLQQQERIDELLKQIARSCSKSRLQVAGSQPDPRAKATDHGQAAGPAACHAACDWQHETALDIPKSHISRIGGQDPTAAFTRSSPRGTGHG